MGVLYHSLKINFSGGRLLRRKRFIHLNDEGRQGLQPGEPRIVDQQLQKAGRRGNRTMYYFVCGTFRVENRLVKRQNVVT